MDRYTRDELLDHQDDFTLPEQGENERASATAALHVVPGRAETSTPLAAGHAYVTNIPRGLCQCGCGEATSLARKSDATRGWVRGEPIDCVRGHKRKRLPERFLSYVPERPSDGCWVWKGHIDKCGYGRLAVTIAPYETRIGLAHRIAYELFVGRIPDGLHIDHLCRNRACVNPAHLEPVTCAENIRRGIGASALNARKEFCDSGHEFTPENTKITKRGWRQCRECHRIDSKRRRQRHKDVT